jgi:hypothetical protein
MNPCKQGDHGDDVAAAHQALIENGFTVGQGELQDHYFGPGTADAVKKFQLAHVDTRPGKGAHALDVDGVVGPATAYALEHPGGGKFTAPGWRYRANDASQYTRPACDVAFGEIGTYEVPDGSNQVAGNKYKNGTQPWCAYFASWCWGHAEAGSPFGVMGGTWSLIRWGQNTGKVVPDSDLAQPGDLWLMPHDSEHGHTEIIVSKQIMLTDSLCNIGGNVGNAVRGTIRSRGNGAVIVRPLGLG